MSPKTTNYRSETSDGLKQEIYAMSIAHFIDAVMLEAAEEAGMDRPFYPSRVVSDHQTRLPECDASSEVSLTQWYRAVVWENQRGTRIPPRATASILA
ncbi:MAG: hypothetical protein R3C59_07765 [Planctomycetaceae bacterium]